MANPQLENGYTKIANELLEALAKTYMSSYEHQIIHYIIRKTYGYNKKSDWISLSQIAKGTGIHLPHVCRTIKKLNQRQIVTQIGNQHYKHYALQKDHDQWHRLPKQVTLPKQVIKVTQIGNINYPNREIQKKKESTTKERYCLEFEKLKESFNTNLYPLIDDFLELTAKANKSGKITDGRKLKMLQALDEMRQYCIKEGEAGLFEHSLTEAIDHDVGNPMYVKAIIRNTLNRIGSEAQENKWDKELAEKEKEARGRINDGSGFEKAG